MKQLWFSYATYIVAMPDLLYKYSCLIASNSFVYTLQCQTGKCDNNSAVQYSQLVFDIVFLQPL